MVHKLATCLTTVLNKTTKTANGVKGKPNYKYYDTQNMSPLFDLVDTFKGIVGYFKKSTFSQN